MIVDVKCDDDTIHIARVVGENENEYTVNFLERVHLHGEFFRASSFKCI